MHRPSRAADQSFLANGIPSCSLYSFLPDGHPDRKPWTGGCAGAWWWHTEHDTRDKADTDILTKDVRLSVGFVHNLATVKVFPLDFHHLAVETKIFVDEVADASATHLDVSKTQELAGMLIIETDRLNKKLSSHAESNVKLANQTLREMGRTLLPLVYTSEGRFTHEAADITPMMSTHRSSMYPGINKAFGLQGAVGTPEYGFLLTQLRRQVNRFNDGLETGIAIARKYSS